MTTAGNAAGQIIPIIGAGISLGILAHTARHVTDTMYPPKYSRKSLRKPRPFLSNTRGRVNYQRLYRPRQRPQYGYRR